MEIYGCTYTEYRDQYEKRLSFYKDKYEDRSESIFLEREMVNFKDFHNVLVSIHNSFIKNKDYNKLVNDPLLNTHLNYLKSNYNNVFRKLFEIGPPLLDGNKNVSQPDDIKEENVRGYIIYFEVTKEKLDNFITSTKRIIDFINDEKTKLQKSVVPENNTNFKDDSTDGNSKNKINPYPQVFSSPEAYQLFEKLHETYKDTKTAIADYSFVYRMMYEDGYILEHFKPGMYRNWLSKHYEIEPDKIKTIHECSTDSKIQTYNMTKKLLKIKPSSFYKKEQKRSVNRT